MQFLLGVLATLCVGFGVALLWTRLEIKGKFDRISTDLQQVKDRIATMPKSVQNIIHLGLKDSRMETGLVPATLSIRPEDFQVQADKLYERLLSGLGTKKHPDLGTRAWSILNHAGIDEVVDGDSRHEAQSALTRLLINSDEEATKNFLRTLADSVCQASVESEIAIH